MTMDGLLFDLVEYTDERIRTIMEGKTCRMWQPYRDR